MELKTFLREFKQRTKYDFCDYSENSISRRLQKISDESGLSHEEILSKVEIDKEFMMRVVEDITVNTTELFRDPPVWIALYKTLYKLLPRSAASITFWHIGCSVGLEVYSNLILLNELGLIDKCRIIGTDINPRVLEKARDGVYAYNFNTYFRENFDRVMTGIGLKVKFEDYFDIDEANDQMRVKRKLTSKPQFMQMDLVQDKPPFAYRVDVVFLRNVMIYFNNTLQLKIMSMVYNKMYDGASLVFGKREALPLSMRSRFESKGQYYQKSTIQ